MNRQRRKRWILSVLACAFLLLLHVLSRQQVRTVVASPQKQARVISTNILGLDSLHTLGTKSVAKRKQWQAGLQTYAKNIALLDSLAYSYLQSAQYDSALIYMRRLKSLVTNDAQKMRLGDLYYYAYNGATLLVQKQTLAKELQELLQPLLDSYPNNADLQRQLAVSHIVGNNPMRGIAQLQSLLKANENDTETLFILAQLAFETNQNALVIKRLKKLLKIMPSHAKGMLYLGQTYARIGRNSEAITYFEQVKKQSKDKWLIHLAEQSLQNITEGVEPLTK